jgi:hypothetical protein
MERRAIIAEAVRNLGDGCSRIGQQRLGGLDVVVGEFGRAAAGAARALNCGEAWLGALSDQNAVELS